MGFVRVRAAADRVERATLAARARWLEQHLGRHSDAVRDPHHPVCVLLELDNKTTEEDVVMAIHNMRATHAGLKFSIQLAAASQNTSEPFGSVRAAIERKFFQGRGIGAFDKLPAGKRPDTLR